MITDILSFTLVVRDQEEALQFYTEKLGFKKTADMPMGPIRAARLETKITWL